MTRPSGTRSKSRALSSRSTRARALDSVGWLTPSTAAVSVTCWWSASATSHSRSRISTHPSYVRRMEKASDRHWTYPIAVRTVVCVHDTQTDDAETATRTTALTGHLPGGAEYRRVMAA